MGIAQALQVEASGKKFTKIQNVWFWKSYEIYVTRQKFYQRGFDTTA